MDLADEVERVWANERRRCNRCGKQATTHAKDPYVAELEPEVENPPKWWCEECLDNRAGDI